MLSVSITSTPHVARHTSKTATAQLRSPLHTVLPTNPPPPTHIVWFLKGARDQVRALPPRAHMVRSHPWGFQCHLGFLSSLNSMLISICSLLRSSFSEGLIDSRATNFIVSQVLGTSMQSLSMKRTSRTCISVSMISEALVSDCQSTSAYGFTIILILDQDEYEDQPFARCYQCAGSSYLSARRRYSRPCWYPISKTE